LRACASDIRDFTTLVENQSPEATIDLLNAFYVLMFDAISSHGGVVNQMIGDGLMALFGAPLPLERSADRAVAAALEMTAMIEQFNVDRGAAGKAPLRIGIGIATGDVIAGYTGTRQRATYTCIGDTVNLAARLEAHTKVAGRAILFEEGTQGSLQAGVRTEVLDAVQLKGMTSAVRIFTVDQECATPHVSD
jgi:adenylate cyclase